ncbi:MADS-box protein SOC1-like protein [Tanacetum coccineum]
MARGKTQLRRIENATSRQVTFSKRRNGLLKKAFELSVLCDAEVALIIFSPRSKLYEFASSSMKETLERYRGHLKETRIQKSLCPEDLQHMRQLAAGMAKEIELLEVAKRKLLGEGLGSSTIEELLQTEQQLERSVCIIRARKMQVYSEKVEQLQSKEKMRKTENAELKEKYQLQMIGGSVERDANFTGMENEETADVETEFGISSRFWEDYWVGDSPLKCSFPRLFRLETVKGCSVSDRTPSPIVSPNNVQLDNTLTPHWSVGPTIPGLTFHWSWRRPIRSGLKLDELTNLVNLLAHLWLSDAPDSWACLIDSSRVFIVRGMRHHIFKSSNSLVLNPIRWNKLVHAKINISSWRITNRNLPTLINLDKRGIDLNSVRCRFNLRRISLTGFPAQSFRSSNADALDSPYLLVLLPERLKADNTIRVNQIVTIFLIKSSIHLLDQNRYPVDTHLIHIESRKSPIAELFEVDSRRISIRHYGMLKSITLNVLAESQG